jgi:hypothetical protein
MLHASNSGGLERRYLPFLWLSWNIDTTEKLPWKIVEQATNFLWTLRQMKRQYWRRSAGRANVNR